MSVQHHTGERKMSLSTPETSGVKRISYRYDEAEAATGLSRETIRRLVDRGEIKTVRVGRCVLIPAAELEKLLTTA
jgi:excisionase family DNA binding protein